MEVKRSYFEIVDRYNDVKEKFENVFGSDDVTMDMHMQDQWIEVSVMVKHLEKMKQSGELDSDLFNMTYDLIDRKVSRLERYINKMA